MTYMDLNQRTLDLGEAMLPLFRPCVRPAGAPPASHYKAIFMWRPDRVTAAGIQADGVPLCAVQGIAASEMFPASRLHMTVAQVWTFGSDMPGDAMQALRISGAHAARDLRSVEVVFDAVGGSSERGAFVLQTAKRCHAALLSQRRLLMDRLTKFGARKLWASAGGKIVGGESPHMTLAYAAPTTQRLSIEPICWQTRSLDLIVSHHGSAHHEVVESWPLGG